MQTRRERHQEDLFVATPLRTLIPEDHILRREDAVLDLSWLHDAVRACYSQDMGRASIDPESALRLMLAGFFEGIVEDRRLMRRAQTDLAFRWFAGYRLDEKLPDHSSLTRIRQRWGSERFEMIFQKTVEACQKAGLVDGTTVHVDATLIRANASMGSVTKHHVEQVQTQNPMTEERSDEEEKPPSSSKSGKRAGASVSRSSTDPDSRMARSRKGQTFAPRYKQHSVCDDKKGIILDVQVTRANITKAGSCWNKYGGRKRVQAFPSPPSPPTRAIPMVKTMPNLKLFPSPPSFLPSPNDATQAMYPQADFATAPGIASCDVPAEKSSNAKAVAQKTPAGPLVPALATVPDAPCAPPVSPPKRVEKSYASWTATKPSCERDVITPEAGIPKPAHTTHAIDGAPKAFTAKLKPNTALHAPHAAVSPT